MQPSDAPLGGTAPPADRDAIQGLGEIVARGYAAVTVLIDEVPDGLGGPLDVRPPADEATRAWACRILDALGEIRGRIVAITSERPGLAARIALGLADALVAGGGDAAIVDGSIEEPIFAKGLPDDGEEGLVDAVLFGVSSSTVARRTLMNGVRLVTTGSYPISVPAVLGADAFERTLQKLAREDATVVLVIPALYASVAASAASQLIIASSDLGGLERLSRELRSVPELSDVRFAALLSTAPPEPVVDEAEAISCGQAGEQPVEAASGDATDAVSRGPALPDAPTEPEPVAEESRRDEVVSREPVLVTANAAFVESAEPETTPQESEPSGGARGRWGALIAVAVVLLAIGVAWRSGVFDGLIGHGEDVPERAVVSDPTATASDAPPEDAAVTPQQDSAETPDDDARRGAEGIPAGDVPARPTSAERAEGEASTGRETGDAAGRRDWRTTAIIPAVPGRYVVFTSSHRRRDAAERDAGVLERRGFASRVVQVEVPDRGTWHRVAVDAAFWTLDDTRELLDIVKEVGYEGAWIERLREPESGLNDATGSPPPTGGVEDTTAAGDDTAGEDGTDDNQPDPGFVEPAEPWIEENSTQE